MIDYQIVLASNSPRRKELLEQIGFRFQILPSQKEEIITKKIPREVVEELACQKAFDVADKLTENYIIIGADTIVSIGNQILGKPGTKEKAFEMLTMLQGKVHQVYTGVTLIRMRAGTKEEILTFHEVTNVEMFSLTQEEIQSYVDTKEPLDKAGAYGIQGKGAVLVRRIEGDYNNVVGLPIARVYQELKRRKWL